MRNGYVLDLQDKFIDHTKIYQDRNIKSFTLCKPQFNQLKKDCFTIVRN